MTKPIEVVIAEAQEALDRSGQLDEDRYLQTYPEYADELRQVFVTMCLLHREKRASILAEETLDSIVALINDAADQSPEPGQTVGALFQDQVNRTGGSVESYARKAGLPISAVKALLHDPTPVSSVQDNLGVKQLAQKISAPVFALLNEIRKLTALGMAGGAPRTVFTRDKDASTGREQQELIRRVLDATGRSTDTERTKPKEP